MVGWECRTEKVTAKLRGTRQFGKRMWLTSRNPRCERAIPLAQTPLMDRRKMPLQKDVIGHFKHMAPDIKSRKDRLKKISRGEAFVDWTTELSDQSGCRDDIRFLYCLTRVMRFPDEHGRFPLVELNKLQNIGKARWNSRAILAILAFIIMPDARRRLKRVCIFNCTAWADRWFSDQKFRVTDFAVLEEALVPYQSALVCLRKHWKQEPSRIDIPRRIQCCERAIKVMQEVFAACKDKSNVPLRFIVANQHWKSSFFEL